MLRRSQRTLLILSLVALPMVGCAGEDDTTGVGKKTVTGKTGTSSTDGTVTGDDSPGGGSVTGSSPLPASPTPSPTPTAPPGFEGTTSSVGAVTIERPQAIGINPAGDVLIASWPRSPQDASKQYRLVVMSMLGTIKQQVDLPVFPMSFGFRGTGAAAETYYTDGRNLFTLDASYSIKTTTEFSQTIPGAFPLAISTSNQALSKAVAANGQVYRYPTSGAPTVLPFAGGGTVRALGFDTLSNLWAAGPTTSDATGSQRVLRYASNPAENPAAIDVSDLGTLNSLSVVVTSGGESGNVWVLGSEKLAYYGPTIDPDTGDIRIQRIRGPYDFGGDRVFLRSGNKPVVVNYAAGSITWLSDTGVPEVGTTSKVSQATMEGGIAGAALDPNGNLWVSSKVQDLIRHTRY